MCPKRLNLLNAAFDKLDFRTRDNVIDAEDIKFWLINNSNKKKINQGKINQVFILILNFKNILF